MYTEPLNRAIALIGLTALAKAAGVKPPTVHVWLRTGRTPAERCLRVEQATRGQVTRYELRPDVYGAPPSPFNSEAA